MESLFKNYTKTEIRRFMLILNEMINYPCSMSEQARRNERLSDEKWLEMYLIIKNIIEIDS